MAKLYYFENSTWNDKYCVIQSAEIIKETEKTYVVKADYPRTIKKSDMRTYGAIFTYFFFETEQQAKQGVIDYLKKAIANCEKNLVEMQQKLSNNKDLLKKYESEN